MQYWTNLTYITAVTNSIIMLQNSICLSIAVKIWWIFIYFQGPASWAFYLDHLILGGELLRSGMHQHFLIFRIWMDMLMVTLQQTAKLQNHRSETLSPRSISSQSKNFKCSYDTWLTIAGWCENGHSSITYVCKQDTDWYQINLSFFRCYQNVVHAEGFSCTRQNRCYKVSKKWCISTPEADWVSLSFKFVAFPTIALVDESQNTSFVYPPHAIQSIYSQMI